jgi:hypothetical protein
MANIQSQIAREVKKFYSWDIKLISQSEIISLRYKLVEGICTFDTADLAKNNSKDIGANYRSPLSSRGLMISLEK